MAMTSKRAMRAPALLAVWCPADDVVDLRGTVADIDTDAVFLRGLDGGGGGVVARFESGHLARDAWRQTTSGAAWRALAPRLSGQPTVHLLAEQDLPFAPVDDACFELVELTRDATLATRDDRRAGPRPKALLPTPTELPGDGGLSAWAVIGHPGRIVALVCPCGRHSPQSLAERWSPLVEPPRRFRLSVAPP